MARALAGNRTVFNLNARVREFFETYRTNRARRLALESAYRELGHMSDRELLEFGLHRSDLLEMARAQAQGDDQTA